MPIRTAITKVSGQGEQIVVDVCQWNPVTGEMVHKDVDEMSMLMEGMLKFADERLHEMNMRMLDAYQFEKYFPPGEWMKVVSIFDVLAGRDSAQHVIQRWEDIKEENAALQAGREAAWQRHVAENGVN